MNVTHFKACGWANSNPVEFSLILMSSDEAEQNWNTSVLINWIRARPANFCTSLATKAIKLYIHSFCYFYLRYRIILLTQLINFINVFIFQLFFCNTLLTCFYVYYFSLMNLLFFVFYDICLFLNIFLFLDICLFLNIFLFLDICLFFL